MAINPAMIAGGILATAAVVGGGLYAGGVFGGGSTGGNSGGGQGITAITIADSEPSSTDYNNKYGSFFKHHFVSATDTKNKDWWDKSFKRLSAAKTGTDISNDFKQAIASSEADTTKHLSQICLTAYKLDYSELTKTEKPNYLRDLWKYCSLEEEMPEVVGTPDNASGQKIQDKHKTKLVAIDGNKNLKFWKIQEDTFFKKTVGAVEKDGMGSGSSTGTTFNTLYTNKNSSQQKTLKAVCQAAYDQQSANANNLETDTIKFCSIAGAIAAAVGGVPGG